MSSIVETIRNAAFIVLIYARFSKDDQNPRSTADQVRSIRYYLQEKGFDHSNAIVIMDEGKSGEILSRPGIDRVRELVAQRKVNLVIAEDVGRFFRDRAEPLKFGGECEDHDVRMIAIEDFVDTAMPDWRDRMTDAGKKHASSNEGVSYRTKRAALGRFDSQHAMGAAKPGYVRTPVDPDDYEKRRRGPFIHSVDPELQPIAEEAYRRAARGEAPWSVANYLTTSGFPRACNAKRPEWTPQSTKDWIKNPIHKGKEPWGRTTSKKHNASGRYKQHVNEPSNVRWRDVPNLALVSEELWQRANDAINARDKVRTERRRGHEHNVRTYTDMLVAEEARQAELQQEIDNLQGELSRERPAVDRHAILERAADLANELSTDDRAFELIRALTTRIEAMPFQRVDCDLVVLRARFTLNLVHLLPDEWQSSLASHGRISGDHALTSTRIEVKLHDEPGPVVHASEALRLSRVVEPKLTVIQIAEALGISRRSTYDAIKLGKLMDKHGLREPYRKLSSEPGSASRWGRIAVQ